LTIVVAEGATPHEAISTTAAEDMRSGSYGCISNNGSSNNNTGSRRRHLESNQLESDQLEIKRLKCIF